MPEVTDPTILSQLNGGGAPARQAPAQGGPVYGAPPAQAKPAPPPTTFQVEDQQWQREDRDRKRREWEAKFNPDGTEKPKGGGDSLDPKTQEGQRNIARNVLSAYGGDKVDNLILGSTSGTVEKFGADLYAGATGLVGQGKATSGMVNIGALKTISSDMTLLMAGGSLGAQISNADREFMAERMADVANPDVPANQRLQAWQEVKQRLAVIAGEDPQQQADPYPAPSTPNDGGGIPGMSVQSLTSDIAAPPPSGLPGGGGSPGERQIDPGTSGELYNMWQNGATPEQINGFLSSKGMTPIDFNSQQAVAAFNWAKDHGDYNPFRAFQDSQPQAPAQSDPENPYVTSLKAGVGDIVQGVGDIAGLFGNPLNATINAATGTNLSTDLGETLRTDVFGLPHGNPTAEAINRGGTAALTGSLAARGAATVANSGPVRNALMQFGSTPARDMVAGATGGASADAARQSGAGPLGQVAAGVVGGVGGYAGAGAASRATNALMPKGHVAPSPAMTNPVVAAGKQEGVRVMTTDVVPPKTIVGRTARTVGENIPFAGTAGPRSAQQAERIAAVKRMAKDFGADDDGALDAVSKDLAKTRGDLIGKLTTAKDSVIDGTPGAVAAPKAIAAIDTQIGKLNAANKDAFAPVVAKLNNFKQVLSSGKSLREVEMNRRLLGDLFEDPSLASIRGDGQKALNAIYAPLRDDMGSFIKAQAGDAAHNKWKGANDQLSSMTGELKASSFKRVLQNSETTPEMVAKLIFSKTPSEVNRLAANLSDAGKIKARAAIVGQALEKAKDGEDISPQKFASAMEAMKASVGGLFDGPDAARVEGMVRLLKATNQATNANAQLMTGARNTGLVAGAGIGTLFGKAAIPVGGLMGLTARAYESAPMRNLLLSLSKTKPGSKAESEVTNRIADMLPKLTAQASARPANDTLGSLMTSSTTAAAANEREKDSGR